MYALVLSHHCLDPQYWLLGHLKYFGCIKYTTLPFQYPLSLCQCIYGLAPWRCCCLHSKIIWFCLFTKLIRSSTADILNQISWSTSLRWWFQMHPLCFYPYRFLRSCRAWVWPSPYFILKPLGNYMKKYYFMGACGYAWMKFTCIRCHLLMAARVNKVIIETQVTTCE